MQNYGLLKIFGGDLSLSRAFNHLCVSVRYTIFLRSVLDLPHLYRVSNKERWRLIRLWRISRPVESDSWKFSMMSSSRSTREHLDRYVMALDNIYRSFGRNARKELHTTWVRILETREESYQEKDLQNVTEARYCQLLLSHSIDTSPEISVPCFQELGRWVRILDRREWNYQKGFHGIYCCLTWYQFG